VDGKWVIYIDVIFFCLASADFDVVMLYCSQLEIFSTMLVLLRVSRFQTLCIFYSLQLCFFLICFAELHTVF
jgi:hypothetical protein